MNRFSCSYFVGPVNELASLLACAVVRGPAVILFSFGVRGKVLYCLLRPGEIFLYHSSIWDIWFSLLFLTSFVHIELVARVPTPLSSDAWSAFGSHNHVEHDLQVRMRALFCDRLALRSHMSRWHMSRRKCPLSTSLSSAPKWMPASLPSPH